MAGALRRLFLQDPNHGETTIDPFFRPRKEPGDTVETLIIAEITGTNETGYSPCYNVPKDDPGRQLEPAPCHWSFLAQLLSQNPC